tara:strand:- start:2752 stop:3021 length:270 start_codon:yes stop_codon:yes gene_type:complete
VSPRTLSFFPSATGAKNSIIWPIYHHTLAITDACGLIASNGLGGFIISTGTGHIYHYAAITKTLSAIETGDHSANDFSWDNHLLPKQLC